MHTSIQNILLVLFALSICNANAQNFERTELDAGLENPWEIIYGPDGFLWISEREGTVCRVHPETGAKTIVFQAEDYHRSTDSERNMCNRRKGSNTYGLALHPDFMDAETPFIYLYYSYNGGTADSSSTLYKIVELTWSLEEDTVTNARDIFTEIPNGYDHYGGRMISVQQNGENYLYFSVGDLGLKTDGCYPNPEDNPNRITQDPMTLNGKIHRIYTDGTIPEDNPIPGNPFYTRGHRNPQGLAYNPNQDVLYDIEHGDRTDDEINVLIPGMNYGWLNIRGYKDDGNYPGELAYAENYEPHPLIANDSLVDPIYSWGTSLQPDSDEFLSWPTVAPSDGIYYGYETIPEWKNSLLIVTLKNGTSTDQEIFQFKLTEDGKALAPSTAADPNPKTFFAEDQEMNGRFRDIATSPDGSKIYLITNNGGNDPIIVYTYQEEVTSVETDLKAITEVKVLPNPFEDFTMIEFFVPSAETVQLEIYDITGKQVFQEKNWTTSVGYNQLSWNAANQAGITLKAGLYIFTLKYKDEYHVGRMILTK